MAYRRTAMRGRRRAPARRTRRAAPRYARRAAPRRTYARRRPAYGRRRAPFRRRAPGRRTVMRNRNTTVMTKRNGDIEIDHMEFVSDLLPSVVATNGVGGFISQTYAFNPALSVNNGGMFSFCNGIANQYQEWQPVHAAVILKSTSGNALYNTSSSGSLGTMGISPSYNTYFNTANISNKVIAESMPGATSGPPSKSQIVRLQTKNSHNPLDTFFCRNSTLSGSQTTAMTDLCNVVVWSQGLQTTSNQAIAEIWVKYRFRLKSVVPGNLLASGANACHYTATTGLTTSAYFGTVTSTVATPKLATGSTMTWTFSGTTMTGVNCSPGNYQLIYTSTGGSASISGPTVSATSGCTALSLFNADGSSLYTSPTATTTAMLSLFYFTVTSAVPVITFQYGAFPVTPNMDLIVTQLPPNLIT